MNKNVIGVVNGFLNELVNAGEGSWSYTLNGKSINMSGSVLGLWSQDFKVNLLKNINGTGRNEILDFDKAKIVTKTKTKLTVSTSKGIITLCVA